MPINQKEKKSYDKRKPTPPSSVSEVYKRYIESLENLSRTYVFFNDMSPLMYWADGRKRFNVYVPPRTNRSKTWKTQYKSAMTRNKCLGVIAHVVSMMISPSIQAQNQNQEEDVILSQFFRDTVEYTQEKENFAVKLFWAITMAVSEGTIILRDNYGELNRTVKDITETDEAGNAVKWSAPKEVKEFLGAFTEIVPNDELLIPNPFITEIQDQDYLIRRKRMTYDQAKARYGNYAPFGQVVPGASFGWNWIDDYFQSYDSVITLEPNEVEVIEMWDKGVDSYCIVANGVELTLPGNPNPRSDKKYPFAKSGYEPIDYNFFWYKGLPDKLQSEQDVYDVLLKMFIDRQHLKLIPPLLTPNSALVNEDIYVPGQITHTGGVPADTAVAAAPGLEGGIDSGLTNLIQMMASNAAQSSLDPMQTGNAPAGGTPTATQAIQMAKNAQIMLGLFGWMVGYLITEWTKLRLNTIVWELSEDTPFSKITLQDKILKSGNVGKRTYLFEKGLLKRSQEQLMEISKTMNAIEKEAGKKLELVALDPSMLSDLSLYVKVDAQPKPKQTDALMQSLAMEKFQVYAARPDVFNLNSAAMALARAWGDNPDDLVIGLKQQEGQNQQMMQSQAGGQAPKTPMMTGARAGLREAVGLPATGAPSMA